MRSFSEIVDSIKEILSFGKKRVFDKDVANALGISQLNFATMKNRNKIPFGELLDFCASRSISINWMLYNQSPESLVETTNRVFMIRYLQDVNASAGGGGEDASESHKEMALSNEFISMLGGVNELKNIEAINVSGDSMEPLFSYNDIVFINRSKKEINRGGVFVIRTQSGLFIKRLQLRVDGKVDVISDNDIYPAMVLKQSDVDVLGKVIMKFGSVE